MQFWCGTAFLPTRDIPVVANLLDQAGCYHGITTSDHLIYPRDLRSPYPTGGKPPWPPETAWPDSWVTIGAMAAVTTKLLFSNAVYVAPARPLLEIAKQVATAAELSAGRVSLALGTGWMREEFELLGQDFDNRGARTDEMIDALRALWQGGWVSFDGEHYQIPELMLEPHPPAPVPIYCGGDTNVALRRAARMCDGWVGKAYRWDDAVPVLERLQNYRRQFGRDDQPFEILLALLELPSADLYRRAADLGVTGVMCSPWAGAPVAPGDAAGYRAGIERFAEDVIARAEV